MYASIAAENAANPTHPTATACGPALRANTPPVIHPPATPLYKSFFARSPSIAHSVPEKMAPTLAKFFPDETDERYMSRRPCLSCCFSGRSEMLVEGVGEMSDADAEAAGADAGADDEDRAWDAAAEGRVVVLGAVLVAAALTALAMGVPDGFAAVGVGVDVGVDGAAPAATGDAFAVANGWPMGVSYRIDAMKRPNMAPRPPPMTPAMTVLPTQDSMDAWICRVC